MVFHPDHAVDHWAQVQWVDPWRRRRAHAEGEGRDAARRDRRLGLHRHSINGGPANSEHAEALVVSGEAQVRLLSGDPAVPRVRAGVPEVERERRAHLSGLECGMERLVNELAMEAEIAGEDERDIVILEPFEAVDNETKRDAVDARRGGRSHGEGECADAARCHEDLLRRRNPVRADPVDCHVGEIRRITGDAKVYLHPDAAPSLPWRHTAVAETHRVAGGHPRRERGRGVLFDERAVEGVGGPPPRWQDEGRAHRESPRDACDYRVAHQTVHASANPDERGMRSPAGTSGDTTYIKRRIRARARGLRERNWSRLGS